MHLPDDLRKAIEDELATTSPQEIARAVQDLSERLRAQHGTTGPSVRYAARDVAAYLAYRVPATFASIGAVFREVRDRRPDLQPNSMLDVGGGPGTAVWAAAEIWPGLETVTVVDRDAEMLRLGKALASHARSRALHDAEWRRTDITGSWDCTPADIAVAAYVVGELSETARETFVGRLWDCTSDTCVIVEPGTPRGYALIRQAGEIMAAGGAHILAPFPLQWECLAHQNDWCHFSVRVPRTRLLRAAKGATLSYEDEKYAYVAASRRPGRPIAARVIRHPQVRSGHIRLVLCTRDGVQHLVVSRSRRDAYRRAKDLVWGAAIPLEEAPLYGLPA